MMPRCWCRPVALGVLVSFAGCSSRNPAIAHWIEHAQVAEAEAKSPEDHLRVAGIYQQILDAGLENADILYNQGNAFHRAGRKGEAIACYRRALRYRPNDVRTLANLSFVQGDDPAGSPSADRSSRFIWLDSIPYHAKLQWAGIGGVLSALGAILVHRWPRRWARMAVHWACGIATLVALSAAWNAIAQGVSEPGVVVGNGSVVRSGDAEQYEPVAEGTLPPGTEFRVLDRRPGWLLIRVGSGIEGWIPAANAVVY